MLRRLAERFLTLSRDPKVLGRISDSLTRVTHAVDAKLRSVAAGERALPEIWSFDRQRRIAPCVRQEPTPWARNVLPECATPGMISREECEYYTYIGQFYGGAGELVELGPWLGRSTFYILQGLADNPNFTGKKKVHVYDDFVWRASWMNTSMPSGEQLPNYADFTFLFDRYAAGLESRLSVEKRKITDFDGNEGVEQLVWTGKPVEMIYVDCGRTFAANEGWWEIFSGSFIPDRTLIILEDWITHREVPVKFYNQIKQWVDSKGPALHLVHELKNGGIATFLYRGAPAPRP